MKRGEGEMPNISLPTFPLHKKGWHEEPPKEEV